MVGYVLDQDIGFYSTRMGAAYLVQYKSKVGTLINVEPRRLSQGRHKNVDPFVTRWPLQTKKGPLHVCNIHSVERASQLHTVRVHCRSGHCYNGFTADLACRFIEFKAPFGA